MNNEDRSHQESEVARAPFKVSDSSSCWMQKGDLKEKSTKSLKFQLLSP